MFVVALLGVGVGAYGPLYFHGADQSVLDTSLAAAPLDQTGLTLTPGSAARGPGGLLAAARAAPGRPGGGRWFGTPIAEEDTGITVEAAGSGQDYTADLVARSGACAHLELVAGQCPTTLDDIVVSTRTAAELGVGLGSHFDVASGAGQARRTPVTVTGLYGETSSRAPYWWGDDYFPYDDGPTRRPDVDDVFASPATVSGAAPAGSMASMAQLPLDRAALSAAEVAGLEAALVRYHDAMAARGVQSATALGGLLAATSSSEHVMTTIGIVVDLQLVLLAVSTLYFVAARTATEREPDLRLAELRGYRTRSTWAVALAEPVVIVALAVPAGLLAAWGLAALTSADLFAPGAGAPLDLLAVACACATGAAGILAVAFGARRSTRAVESGLSVDGGGAGAPTKWRVAGDVGAVALAVAAVAELVVSGVSGGTDAGRVDPLAALAPGLLALGVGVVAARGLPAVVRLTLPLTRYSRHVAAALATRRVARRPEFAAQIVLVVVAVSLTVFGVSGWAIAARNRANAAEFTVGASRVLTVAVRPGVDFLSATRAADGGRRTAMAVVVENASDGTTLAVDSSRLAQVAAAPAGLRPSEVQRTADRLVPRDLAPSVTVSGTELRVTADARFDLQPAPELSVDLFDGGYQTPAQVVLGPLAPGVASYRGSLAGLCPSGCRLVDLAVSWGPPLTDTVASGSVHLVVSSMATASGAGAWRPVAAGLTDAGRWTTTAGSAALGSSPAGLDSRMSVSAFGAPTTIAPADVPRQLPSVVTTSLAEGDRAAGGAPTLVGLDGATVSTRTVGQVSSLPRVGDAASLVDLGLAERLLSGPMTDVVTEVWLSPAAPAALEDRLADRGITVLAVDSARSRQAALDRGGPALAFSLFLASAVAAGVLAVGTTAFALVVSARRRRREFASMRAVGVTRRILRRSVEFEQALAVGTALLLGAVTGLVATVLAIGSVPEFTGPNTGPPLDVGIPGVATTLTIAALGVALAVAVAWGALAVVGSASSRHLGDPT
jgi:hypothetical protein